MGTPGATPETVRQPPRAAPEAAVQPVLASAWLRPILTGPPRTGRVLASTRAAVYLALDPVDAPRRPGPADLGDRPGGADVLAVLSTEAVRLPIGLILPAAPGSGPAAPGSGAAGRAGPAGPPLPVRPGQPVAVTVEGLRVGTALLRPARWWDPDVRRPLLAGAPCWSRVTLAARQLPALPPELTRAPPVTRLAALLPTVPRLVGLGPGLTPAGDDLLGGVLAALRAVDPPAADQLAAVVLRYAGRTTALSAALLRAAAGGASVPPVRALLAALCPGAPDNRPADGPGMPAEPGMPEDLRRAVDAVRAVGASSGTALGHGVLLALRLVRRPAAAAA